MKHTPGPWKLDSSNIVAENGKTVIDRGSLLWNYGEGQSNAQLIAAAPELLEACQAAVAWHLAQDGTEKAWTLGASSLAAGVAIVILPETAAAALGLAWFLLAVLLLAAFPD